MTESVELPKNFPWCDEDRGKDEFWVWPEEQTLPVATLNSVRLQNPRKSTYQVLKTWLEENSLDWRMYFYVDHIIGVHETTYKARTLDSSSTPVLLIMVDDQTQVLMKLKFGDMYGC